MTGFEVVPDELTAHADHLDGLGDRLETALAAAKAASMPGDAYGLLCAFLPPVVNPVGERGVAAVQASGEAMRTTAANVRTAGAAYAVREETTAKPFREAIIEKGQ
ncbi:type VII secretion target [Amycolatopsis lurida]|uniref:type VII secretion target n=1 Tax=Amycolatopsis sp. YIM 10 TaxID=2653857 RepID=UPI00128FFDB4|nr:type VII secretion target [Amycolatopsis sp. YIM 10]QFU91644.1 hypothetical protein YIM_32415 [Amycolatopsis sp. YIM 10]